MKQGLRKPLELQKGHLTKAAIEKKKQEQARVATGTDEVLKPPAWLDQIAKKEWKRVVPQLLKIEVVGNLDFSSIAGYCAAFSAYRRVTETLKDQPFIVLSPDGRPIENPLIKTQRDAAGEMRKFADMAGLSISARLKASATKTNKIEDEIKEDFGDI